MAEKLVYLRETIHNIFTLTHDFIFPCSCFNCIVKKYHKLKRKKLLQTFDRGGHQSRLCSLKSHVHDKLYAIYLLHDQAWHLLSVKMLW